MSAVPNTLSDFEARFRDQAQEETQPQLKAKRTLKSDVAGLGANIKTRTEDATFISLGVFIGSAWMMIHSTKPGGPLPTFVWPLLAAGSAGYIAGRLAMGDASAILHRHSRQGLALAIGFIIGGVMMAANITVPTSKHALGLPFEQPAAAEAAPITATPVADEVSPKA